MIHSLLLIWLVLFAASHRIHSVFYFFILPQYSPDQHTDCLWRLGTRAFSPNHNAPTNNHARSHIISILHLVQAGETVYTTPPKRFGDGVFHVMLMRRRHCTRFRLARILLGYATGSHVHLPGLEWITCTSYEWIPEDPDASFNDLDGEVVERGGVAGMFDFVVVLCIRVGRCMCFSRVVRGWMHE